MGGRPGPIVELFKKAINGEPLPRIAKADESLDNWNYNQEMPLIKTLRFTVQSKSAKAAAETASSAHPPCSTKLMCRLKKS
jgi:hypothetical protein